MQQQPQQPPPPPPPQQEGKQQQRQQAHTQTHQQLEPQHKGCSFVRVGRAVKTAFKRVFGQRQTQAEKKSTKEERRVQQIQESKGEAAQREAERARQAALAGAGEARRRQQAQQTATRATRPPVFYSTAAAMHSPRSPSFSPSNSAFSPWSVYASPEHSPTTPAIQPSPLLLASSSYAPPTTAYTSSSASLTLCSDMSDSVPSTMPALSLPAQAQAATSSSVTFVEPQTSTDAVLSPLTSLPLPTPSRQPPPLLLPFPPPDATAYQPAHPASHTRPIPAAPMPRRRSPLPTPSFSLPAPSFSIPSRPMTPPPPSLSSSVYRSPLLLSSAPLTPATRPPTPYDSPPTLPLSSPVLTASCHVPITCPTSPTHSSLHSPPPTTTQQAHLLANTLHCPPPPAASSSPTPQSFDKHCSGPESIYARTVKFVKPFAIARAVWPESCAPPPQIYPQNAKRKGRRKLIGDACADLYNLDDVECVVVDSEEELERAKIVAERELGIAGTERGRAMDRGAGSATRGNNSKAVRKGKQEEEEEKCVAVCFEGVKLTGGRGVSMRDVVNRARGVCRNGRNGSRNGGSWQGCGSVGSWAQEMEQEWEMDRGWRWLKNEESEMKLEANGENLHPITGEEKEMLSCKGKNGQYGSEGSAVVEQKRERGEGSFAYAEPILPATDRQLPLIAVAVSTTAVLCFDMVTILQDPLSTLALAVIDFLRSLFESPNITTVFHDCREQSEVAATHFGLDFKRVHDTQAWHCVLHSTVSRETFTKLLLHYGLEKPRNSHGSDSDSEHTRRHKRHVHTHTHTNPARTFARMYYHVQPDIWAKRPLTQEMVTVACFDVIGLRHVRERQLHKLAKIAKKSAKMAKKEGVGFAGAAARGIGGGDVEEVHRMIKRLCERESELAAREHTRAYRCRLMVEDMAAVSDVIGEGARNIEEIERKTGASLSRRGDREWCVMGEAEAAVRLAVGMIERCVKEE